MLSPSLSLYSVLKGGVVHQLLADKKQEAGFYWETAANEELEFKTAEIQNKDFTTPSEAHLQIWACYRQWSSVSGGLPPDSLFQRPLSTPEPPRHNGVLSSSSGKYWKAKDLKAIWEMFCLWIGFIWLVAHELAYTEKKKRVGARHRSLHRWHKPLHPLLSSKRV